MPGGKLFNDISLLFQSKNVPCLERESVGKESAFPAASLDTSFPPCRSRSRSRSERQRTIEALISYTKPLHWLVASRSALGRTGVAFGKPDRRSEQVLKSCCITSVSRRGFLALNNLVKVSELYRTFLGLLVQTGSQSYKVNEMHALLSFCTAS